MTVNYRADHVLARAGTFGAGVYLADGGSVTNGASGATAGLIFGNSNAVAIFFTPGTVTNFGTIESIGSASYGVVISAGGAVANFGTILQTGTSGGAGSSSAAARRGPTGCPPRRGGCRPGRRRARSARSPSSSSASGRG